MPLIKLVFATPTLVAPDALTTLIMVLSVLLEFEIVLKFNLYYGLDGVILCMVVNLVDLQELLALLRETFDATLILTQFKIFFIPIAFIPDNYIELNRQKDYIDKIKNQKLECPFFYVAGNELSYVFGLSYSLLVQVQHLDFQINFYLLKLNGEWLGTVGLYLLIKVDSSLSQAILLAVPQVNVFNLYFTLSVWCLFKSIVMRLSLIAFRQNLRNRLLSFSFFLTKLYLRLHQNQTMVSTLVQDNSSITLFFTNYSLQRVSLSSLNLSFQLREQSPSELFQKTFFLTESIRLFLYFLILIAKSLFFLIYCCFNCSICYFYLNAKKYPFLITCIPFSDRFDFIKLFLLMVYATIEAFVEGFKIFQFTRHFSQLFICLS